MPEALAVGQIMRLTYSGTLLGQQILNLQDYRVEVVPGGGFVTDGYTFIQNWIGGANKHVDKFCAAVPNNYKLVETWVQCISPIRVVKSAVTRNQDGDRTITDASNIQQSIEKHGEKATRYSVGGMRLPVGTNADDIAIGFLTAGQFAALAAFAAQSLEQIGNGTTEMTFRPIIYNPSFIPNFQYMVTCTAKNTVRTQHRRTVGLGK